MSFLPAIIPNGHFRLNQYVSKVLPIDYHVSRYPEIPSPLHVL